MELEIREAASQGDIDGCRTLMGEYSEWLKDGVCAQGFAEEMAGLPGKYAPPEGRLLIATAGGEPAGCIAFRRFDAETAEAKRLWVSPRFRKHGVGVALLRRMVVEVKATGYRRVVFNTLPKMESALRLYTALEFERIEAYFGSSLQGVMCFEKLL